MNKYKYLINILVYIVVINGEQEICDYSDKECVFNAAKTVYPKMVAGMEGVETSDPLHKEEILVTLPRFTYKLHDVTMTGIKDSDFKYINFFKNGTFSFGIEVPATRIKANYEIHGQLDEMVLNGKGVCEITYYDHKLDFIGSYYTSKDFVDKKIHNYIGDFKFLSEVRGKSVFNYENLKNSDSELTENDLIKLDETVHDHIITEFLQKHIVNIDDYLRIIPFNEVNGRSN